MAFIGPTELLSELRVRDWREEWRSQKIPMVAVVHSDVSIPTIHILEKARINLLSYNDIDQIVPFVQSATMRSRNEIGAHITEFAGVVDGLKPPATLSGWVSLKRQNRFVNDLRIIALNGQTTLAVTYPSYPRPDATGSADYLAGFSIDCSAVFSLHDVLEGRIRVVAVDSGGTQYQVGFFGNVINYLRANATQEHSADFLKTDIGKLMTKTKL